MKKLLLSWAITMAASDPALADDAACIQRAESEFGVPSGLISVMKTSEKPGAEEKFRLYGPMGLQARVIAEAAEGLHVDPDAIRNDRCTNFSAAAWLLMNTSGGSQEKDIFTAVNRYYYGHGKLQPGRQTQLIQRRWRLETGQDAAVK